jgi:HSP20 family protein
MPTRRNDEMTRLFDSFFDGWGEMKPTSMRRELANFSPSINLKEDEERYILEAELAGISRDDIDVSIKDHAIHLKGEKRTFNEDKKEDYHHVERTYGSFYRTIQLGTDADDEKISADFRDGLLTIEVEKHRGPEKGHRKIQF